MDLQQLLSRLSETPGLSGYEGGVREAVREAWDGLVDELSVDSMGTLLATKRGRGEEPRRRVLVTAHMDEIGLMVTRIEGDFLRITSVGGIDRRVLLSQPVTVHGERPLPGLIGSRPPHVLPAAERKKYPETEDLVVDTGLHEDELKRLVRVGAPVTFDRRAVSLGNGLLSGKALDNRVSVAVLTETLSLLQGRAHAWDVLAAATVQEEVTLGGGRTIAWRTQPDIAVVLDVTFGTGNGVGEDEGFKLGEGPTLVIGPNAHPRLFDLIKDKAAALEIDLHPEPAPRSSGTEGWAIQISRDGVPTAIVSVPIRNMHTPAEIVSLKDVRRAARLVAEFITGLDGETLGRLSLDGQ